MSSSFYRLFVPTVFFFACCFFTALIQAQPVDSLKKSSLKEVLRASTNLAVVKKHIQARELDSAEQLAKESRRVLGKAFGNQSPHVAIWLEELGKIYFAQNKFNLALTTLDSALNIHNRVRRVDHPQNWSIYNNMGVINLVLGNYVKADSLLRKAISICPDTSFVINPYKALAQNFLARSQLDSALHYYLLTLSYCDTSKQSPFVGQIYADLGQVYTDLADYAAAEKYLLLASKNISEVEQANLLSRSDIASTMSRLHLLKGEYNLALKYAEEAMALVTQDVNQLPHSLGLRYSVLGDVWQYKGDHQLAGEFFELALFYLEKSLHSKHRDVVLSLRKIADYLANSGQTKRAIKQYHKGLEIVLSMFGPEHEVTNGFYFRLAQAYQDVQDTSTARQYYLKAFNSGQKLYPVHHYEMCRLRRGIGFYFSRTGAYTTAIPYFINNLGWYSQIPQAELAMDYCGLAWCYAQLRQYSRADSFIRKALFFFNYHPNNFGATNALNDLVDGLKTAAVLYQNWYEHTAQLSHLRLARFYALQSIAAIDELTTEFSTESKIPIAKLAHQRYTLATQINLELYAKTDSLHYRQQAFNFAERSKALLLLSSMQEQSALTATTNIPPALLQQEYQLRVDLTHLGKKRQEKLAEGYAETDTTILAYSAKIKNLKDQATALKAKLEKEYPRYYATKYELKTIDVRSIQSKILAPNQTLLEYLVGDSSIFIFVIQKQKYGTIEIKKDFPLEQWVENLTTNGMAKVKKLNPNATANYTEAAFLLYEKLIAPVLKANYLLGQELIIVPDGILGQVPFEALLTSKPAILGNYANYHYLLKQHQISYCYSATLLAQMIEKKHQKAPAATLLAMAPFAASRTSSLKPSPDSSKVRSAFLPLKDSLSSLQYSGEEIKTIAQRWAGQLFYNRDANLNEFVKSADKYRIIHLATHGKADARAGDYSFLAFHHGSIDSLYDKLYARDLYNLSLNADMVVLSACETGVGELQKGEGIVSLARAFTFAGAKSIVTTLWSMNDAKTKELMAFFYAELEKPGMRKDAALRNAKLRYLQQFNTEADPLFWAGFVAIGDMSNFK